MREPHVLRTEQWVPSPVEEVFSFFSDATNLEILTPPWLNFRILTSTPIVIAKGTIIRYLLRWRGIPIGWKTEITRWEPPYAFEDFQVSGPYRLWHHTHTFESVRGGTRMTDTVRYELPFGQLGILVHKLAVKKNVEAIFDYRYSRIHALFGGEKRATAVKGWEKPDPEIEAGQRA